MTEPPNMRWIDKNPPLYVHIKDKWYNERNKKTYTASLDGWRCEDDLIPYAKKTRISR